MESFAHSLAPQLLAIQHQEWDWNDGCADSYVYGFASHNRNLPATSQPQPNEPTGEDLSSALPDELLERIFVLLPVTNIFRAGAVCKRWHHISTSQRFLSLCEERTTSRPWYFMYKDSQNSAGLAYDPAAKKWHNFRLPQMEASSGFAASADGLVCFVDSSIGHDFYLCNPMIKTWMKLPSPPEKWMSDYYSVSMTVDKGRNVQTTVVARSKQVPDDYSRWNLSIEVFDTSLQKWQTRVSTILHGWRGGENSVICNGSFYCVTHSTALVGGGDDGCRHGLIVYQLASGTLSMVSMGMPCSLTCVKLMNCNGKLTMVGGIGKSDIIKGIGIWVLDSEWREIARMPNKFFRGFGGEFDDVFSSSGSGDLIYIHAYGSPQLLLYDITQRSWRWSQKCPLVKKHPLHLFTGFCFEPRLEGLSTLQVQACT